MHPTLTIAKNAALAAGKIITRHMERVDRLGVSRKRERDFVTEVDVQAEQEIIRVLRRSYPDHAILAEESGHAGPKSAEFEWLVDPLDGTTNYLHGFPQFAVSIALRQSSRLVSGLVYDPLRMEMFTAAKGQGAMLNDRRIRVRNLATLDDALLGTGFPMRHPQYQAAFLALLGSLFGKCSEIRRAGSAALDLAFVAAGRLDGFWEIGLNPWDMAAGALLVQEAGGLVGDFSGGHDFLATGSVVAGNPKVFKALLQEIQPHFGARQGQV